MVQKVNSSVNGASISAFEIVSSERYGLVGTNPGLRGLGEFDLSSLSLATGDKLTADVSALAKVHAQRCILG